MTIVGLILNDDGETQRWWYFLYIPIMDDWVKLSVRGVGALGLHEMLKTVKC